MNRDHNTHRGAWVGVLLVVLGGYFLLRNFHMIPSFLPYWVFSWEMVFILIGGSMLVSRKPAGFIFLIIGGLSILPEIFYWPQVHLRDWWPLILIAIGVSIFLKKRRYEARQLSDEDGDYFEDTSIFGGSEKIISSQNFKGGRVTAIFGGSELNLTEAKLAANSEAVVDLFCMFGGNTLIVPADWTVKREAAMIFGGYGDKQDYANTIKNPSKVLRITGMCIFGGGEIRRV